MSPQSTFSSTASPTNLYITTIILYALLILPTFYIWRRHGRQGFLAYNFVYAFCAIRITGAVLSIVAVHDVSLETAAAVVNSVAISPLLLAALGVLHEARNTRIADVDSRREWMGVGGLHGIVTTGMVLVIIGIINVVEGVSTTANSGIIKAGLTVLVLAYVVLLIWTTLSLRQPIRRRDETFGDGTLVSFSPSWLRFHIADSTKLLQTTFAALPFIGMRLAYGAISFLLLDPTFARSLAAKVILSFIPELVATTLFVYGGYRTCDMYASRHREIVCKA
jgi:hypothetical protein